MAIFYSASGFFDDRLHKNIPADAVEISAARHQELLDAQAAGKTISADANGRPKASAPKRTVEDLRARAIRQTKRQAAQFIESVAPVWKQINALRSEEGAAHPLFAKIDAIRTASDQIEASLIEMGAKQLDTFKPGADPRWPTEGH